MVKEFDKKYTWVIKNFSPSQSKDIYSNQFINGGCKWHFTVYPKGYMASGSMILYLCVADYMSLPSGWRRHAKISLTIVNQLNKKLSQRKETQEWFHENYSRWRFNFPFPLDVLHAKDGGFVVNGELIVVAEVKVLEVIGKLDVSEETSLAVMEHVDVNGFHVPSLEVESVKRLFDKYPDIASNFCPKNPFLKTPYMSLLLGVIKTISYSSQEISKKDLADASTTIVFLKVAGFKLDWLEKKLEEARENKERVVAAKIRMREIDEKLKHLKDQEALLEKEKANILAASASLKVDDVF